jgi:hypothetical protein
LKHQPIIFYGEDMKRKEFLKNTGIFIGGSLTIPSLLASDKRGQKISDYVILINLGGGIRKQDVFGYNNSIKINDLYRSETIIPSFFGGEFPQRFRNIGSQNIQFPTDKKLINQGILFSEVETLSNDHESCFKSLVTANESINGKIYNHSVFSFLSKYKGFNKDQMWQIGGIPLANSENHTYVKSGASDIETLSSALNVIQNYQPKFLNINLNDADSCHSSYTTYLKSIVNSTDSIYQFWKNLQKSNSKMSGKTTLIVIPEIGRNLEPNSIVDQHGFYSYDHSDDNSRRTWSLIVGAGVSESSRNQIISDARKSHQILPTITHLFGVSDKIQRRHNLINGFKSLLG